MAKHSISMALLMNRIRNLEEKNDTLRRVIARLMKTRVADDTERLVKMEQAKQNYIETILEGGRICGVIR